MKNIKYLLCIVLSLLAINQTTSANNIVLTQNQYTSGTGGEFHAVTSQNGTFQTFCVQPSVYFTPGNIYSYTLANSDSHGNPLSKGTALLFSEFSSGTLAGYNYTDANIRSYDAGLLQSAIWGLQFGNVVNNNPYYSYACNVLGNTVFDANNGQYGVQIVQLWAGNCEAQNQLISVPDSCSVLLLLSVSMLVLLVIRYGLQPTGGVVPAL